jgi:flagellar protein FlaH
MTTTDGTSINGISTGQPEIDLQIGSGIPRGSLAMIEGNHAAGKSVLCEHLTYSALQAGSSVAFYTSETGSPSLIQRMNSLGMDVLDQFLLGKLRILPLELAEFYPRPDELLETVREHIMALPPQFDFVLVDTLTSFLPRCTRSDLLDFFVECRRMCAEGKTIVLTLDSRASLERITADLSRWCDIHLKLQMEAVMVQRVVKALEVVKTGHGPGKSRSKVHFEVHDGVGIHMVRPQ